MKETFSPKMEVSLHEPALRSCQLVVSVVCISAAMVSYGCLLEALLLFLLFPLDLVFFLLL